MPSRLNLVRVRAATFCLVNRERTRHGERALLPSVQLANTPQRHSEDMVARDYFGHVGPGGDTLLSRIRASGFIPNGRVGYSIGENIAWGTLWLATPRVIVAAWIASPDHLANILNRQFRYSEIGVDPAVPASFARHQSGGTYTQDFAVIITG